MAFIRKDPKNMRFAVLAADTALFTLRGNELLIRLIRVNRPPHFRNIPGLPGGLLHPEETAEKAAIRHLTEKTKIGKEKIYLEQLYTFSRIDRDPRGRVVAVAYLGLIPWDQLSAKEREGTNESWWANMNDLPRLAYDHDEIIRVALDRIRSRVTYTTLMAKLMPSKFTLTELETAYETAVGKGIDKRNFRKKVQRLKLVRSLNQKRVGEKHRPAMLYGFRSLKVRELEIL